VSEKLARAGSGEAAALDVVLRAVADGNRRLILSAIRSQPRAVGEIANDLALSQQTTSHHLHVLNRAGLVREERDGTRHLYMLRTDGLDIVRDFLDSFWPKRLAALKAAAEKTARGRGRE
jgi:DNA-binding transcriptional ArsR family regulator